MNLTPEDVAYLRQQAAAQGYNADHALKVFNYESSGRPDVWGGKGNAYFGLFQAGAPERKQFGVDTAHPSARNQIDAFGKFLAARGYKPGMSLLDMYSTVNAGSPGHYSASDGNGTVQSHVAKMLGQEAPKTLPEATAPLPAGLLSYAAQEKPRDDIAALLSQPAQANDPIGDLLSQLETQKKPQPQVDTSLNDDFLRQLSDFHNQRHAMAVQGLL
ncbi:MAG: hypothetical protein ACR2IL_10730 [Chitinophagaceae bacterium]